MATSPKSQQSLLDEIASLRAQLAEAQEAQEVLRAIRQGEVDTLVVDSPGGPLLFTLQGLDAASNRFRGEVLELVDDAVLVMSEDALVTYLNTAAEQLYAITASVALGHPLAVLYETAWLTPEDEAAAAACWRGHSTWSGETIQTTRDGRRLHVESTLKRLQPSPNRPAGWLMVTRDISAHKHTEAMLRDADIQKNNFIATLAHELRNPLAPIRNAVHLLRHDNLDNVQRHRCREIIERQLEQMVRLLDDLLDVSRVGRNLLTLRRETLDVTAAIEQAIEIAQPAIQAGQHALSVKLPDQNLPVDADATRLAQIFSNLLINAAKYSEPQGKIAVTARRGVDEVVVSVKDAGIGIPAEHLSRLFEMFRQVPGARDRSQGGLGIGLALVRALVQMHGGQVSAHSDGLGHGSEFVVRLPLANAASRPGEAEPRTQTVKEAAPAKLRILVIDDVRDSADMLGMLLGTMGHDVRVGYSGEEAVSAAEAFRPDAAFIDLGMPDIDGYEACRRIRAQSWGKAVALIALTGRGQSDDLRRTSEAGFDHHLVKPVAAETLSSLLRRYQP